MPKTHPVSIATPTHGLAGNLVLPDGATAVSPVPGAVILGGPGPLPLQRYSPDGARQWPVLWTEALAADGLAGLCYDQRGSGLSSGQYVDADWSDLLEDARAAADMLRVQPEVGRIAAVAWADGTGFALQLAAEGKVDALVLLAPGYYNAEERYARGIAELAARRGLSQRVVDIRVNQWRQEILAATQKAQQGQTTTVTDLGNGQTVTTNLIRFLQTAAFNPADVAPHVNMPVLLLHGEDDTAIPPAESQALAQAIPGATDRLTYRGVAHFIYRYSRPMGDATAWLKQVLGQP
jgi:pimeloyl-ACP methyl ester carboxylesterase